MNIFIVKLSSSTTSEGLVEIFQQFGEVESAKVIMDRETGVSKGYGGGGFSGGGGFRKPSRPFGSNDSQGQNRSFKKDFKPKGGNRERFRPEEEY